jgi:hypothetical protein
MSEFPSIVPIHRPPLPFYSWLMTRAAISSSLAASVFSPLPPEGTAVAETDAGSENREKQTPFQDRKQSAAILAVLNLFDIFNGRFS